MPFPGCSFSLYRVVAKVFMVDEMLSALLKRINEKSDRKTSSCQNKGTDNIDVPAPADEAVGKP